MYRNWQVTLDEHQVCTLVLDKADARVNTLDLSVLNELEQILSEQLSKNALTGLVIQSGKKSGFIAGADIEPFKRAHSAKAVKGLLDQGHAVFAQLESLPFPTVAVIEGFCLGGGLELALACRYRVVLLDPKVRLGLPEVKLGLHPGWGGTIRLPRLIGSFKAMDLILSGRTLSAKVACRWGLADQAVLKRHLSSAVRACLQQKTRVKKPCGLAWFSNIECLRPLFAKFIRRKLAGKISQAHYPAPFAVLDNWVLYGIKNQASFVAEVDSFLQIMLSHTAKQLMRVFFLQERLKSQAKSCDFHPRWVHVVGAGVMGGDIACICSLQGFFVSVSDPNPKALASMLKRAHHFFKIKLKERHLVQAAMDRLYPDPAARSLKQADLIIEAVVEDLSIKQAVFKQIEAQARVDALIATNTSTIPLEAIGSVLKQPNRLVGIHFFNPVAKMLLVEVVSDPKTDPAVRQNAIGFVHQLGKLPLPVKSAPGFLVNRLLMPYLLESMLLLKEGVPAQIIDQAAIKFGMPMGPIELADHVGLDVCLCAAEQLGQYLGLEPPPKQLVALVEQGYLGKKTGEGFYVYRAGRRCLEPVNAEYTPPEDLSDRLILSILNQAMACLREGIIEDADLLDAGMIFGTGFAPFLGGPMAYLASEGQAALRSRLAVLAGKHGSRFESDSGWDKAV